nr:ankyrin repeat-containing domain, PGG domain protein [Tanacetum cinerariifolium]
MTKTEASAFSAGRIDLAKSVLRNGEVTVTDKITNNGNTTLHVAVGTSKDPDFIVEMLEYTPENTPIVDLKNADRSTLLHIVATVGNIAGAKILVERYPNILIEKDNEGQTPLALALSNIHIETAKWFQKISYLFWSAIRKCAFPFVKRRLQIRDDAHRLLMDVCNFMTNSISSSRHKNYYTNLILEATKQNALEGNVRDKNVGLSD